ncbi:5'/3'-nucleotidase SurE [Microbacterium sp. SD291]|uniref:5'/3'-nucleotidase SurE n=1 Tax=Microbacterium sp. SD291 TaxID=2782007 RepID=UPI001A971617|nr:5'/3'-nucleotidase SurE [Microbacterium sp. SD291]MBO0981245.1 5'/3'-nucleotidase SurE [Microbacterium sp. SD291]
MTRALITNDDGIDAPGLAALARAALTAGLDPVIAAPVRQSSGSSASIVAAEEGGRVAVDERTLEGLEGVPAYAVHGGPGLIALIAARGAFGEPVGLVLSGVNHGANVGRAILHSGTVGAALTGGLNGARAVAISLDVGMHPDVFHWDAAAGAALSLLPQLLRRPVGAVINVNVPNRAEHRGIREAALAPFGIVQTTMAEAESHYIRLAVEELPNTPEEGTDAALLAEGWITVTGIDSVAACPFPLDASPDDRDREGQSGGVTEISPVPGDSPASGGSGTR